MAINIANRYQYQLQYHHTCHLKAAQSTKYLPSFNIPKHCCSRPFETFVSVIVLVPGLPYFGKIFTIVVLFSRFQRVVQLFIQRFFSLQSDWCHFQNILGIIVVLMETQKMYVMFVLLARKIKLLVGKDIIFTSNSGVTPQYC